MTVGIANDRERQLDHETKIYLEKRKKFVKNQ
jgi:hypothetical protein